MTAEWLQKFSISREIPLDGFFFEVIFLSNLHEKIKK